MSATWRDQRVVTFNGAYDTNIDNGLDYDTRTLGGLFKMKPTALAKDGAPAIIPSSYARFDARTHAVQKAHGLYVAICGDIDKGNVDCAKIAALLVKYFGEVAYLIYSSSRSTEDDKRWRFIVPLAVGIPFAEWVEMVHALYAFMEANGVSMDWSLAGAGQPVYLPNVPPERRDASGKPNFYETLQSEGEATNGQSPLALEWIGKLRQEREERNQRFAKEKGQPRVRSGSGGSPIEIFNASVDLADSLLSHGYEQSPYNDMDFRSPYQTSGSYATRIMSGEDGRQYFVSLSGSDAEHGLGAETVGGHRFGDAFDLHAHFNHGGDVEAALRDMEPQTLVDPMRVRQLVEPPVPVTRGMPPPFPGVMKEIVDSGLAASFKPQVKILTLAVLIAMASACGGRFKMPNGMRLNLYGFAVAKSGEGKDQSLHVARATAKHAGAILVGAAGSSQGIEDSLVDNAGILSTIDEISHTLAAINSSDAPTYLKSLVGAYLALFSASKSLYTTRALAHKPVRTVERPCLSLFGCATPEMLGKALRLENVTDGLLGRMLMTIAADHVPVRRVSTEFKLPALAAQRAQEITLTHIGQIGESHEIEIQISPEASARLDELLTGFDEEKRDADSDQALLARSYEKVERIAGVLAIWDSPRTPVIKTPHVDWAEAAVRSSNENIRDFVRGRLFADTTQADAGRVFEVVKRILSGEIKPETAAQSVAVGKGMVPKNMALRYSRLSKKLFDLATEHLIALGDLELGFLENPSDGAAPGKRKLGVLYLPKDQES